MLHDTTSKEGRPPKHALVHTSQTTPAGDFDYEAHGAGYSLARRTDPRIAALVHKALGPAKTVLNVGAGAGSYEPEALYVLAIEPSAKMRSQRPKHLAPAIDAVAERLPLDDQSVDAAMAMVTVHQWRDVRQGLAELCRVTRGSIVLLTFDGDALDRFWLTHYAPELIQAEKRRFPSIALLQNALGTLTTVHTVPIPFDCTDGFIEAFYGRPERFLEPAVRHSQSAWGFVDPNVQNRFVAELAADLKSGSWDARYGHLRHQSFFEGALRLLVSDPVGRSDPEQFNFFSCRTR